MSASAWGLSGQGAARRGARGFAAREWPSLFLLRGRRVEKERGTPAVPPRDRTEMRRRLRNGHRWDT